MLPIRILPFKMYIHRVILQQGAMQVACCHHLQRTSYIHASQGSVGAWQCSRLPCKISSAHFQSSFPVHSIKEVRPTVGIASLVYKEPGSEASHHFVSKRSFCSVGDGLSAEKTIQFQEVCQWIDRQRQYIYEIPTVIEDDDIEQLCLLSNNQRKKFLCKLFKKEQERLSGRKKRKVKSKEYKSKPLKTFDKSLGDSYVLRTRDETILNYHRWRVAAAMKFGPDIAFDFTYDQLMSSKQLASVTNQLKWVHNSNLFAPEPFHLHWVNFHENGPCMQEMKRVNYATDSLMVDITSKSLLDVFQHDRIVYLCPDSSNIITSYDPTKVYVLGALCAEGGSESGVLIAQAKKLNLTHGRFPYRGKYPNLAGLMDILITMNSARDFPKALQQSPQRRSSHVQERFYFSRARHQRRWDVNS